MNPVYGRKLLITSILAVSALIFSSLLVASPPTRSTLKFKEPPKKRVDGAQLVVESQEILSDCDAELICVEGLVYNQGNKTAFQAKLRIFLGGGKHIKPRTSIIKPLATKTMDSGERQEFSIKIPRRHIYKQQGKERIVEVGRFNFNIEPEWKDTPQSPPPPKSKK
jgi:hypothetical protein